MDAPSHYELLCVAPDATADEIRTAYRRLIRVYHPDVAGAPGEAMSFRFNDAHRELLDPVLRAQYDRRLRTGGADSAATRGTRSPEAANRTQQGSYSQQRSGSQQRTGSQQRPGTQQRPGAQRTTSAPRPEAPRPESTPPKRAAQWSAGRFRFWLGTMIASIIIVIAATAIVFAYCYSGPMTLTTPSVVPAMVVGLAWLVGALSRPPKLFIAVLVIGASLGPFAALGMSPFAELSATLPPLIVALPSVVTVAVFVLRLSAPKTVELSRSNPARQSTRRNHAFHTARG